jgi:glycine/D-amino acid oxidase-like deaminating enzyme
MVRPDAAGRLLAGAEAGGSQLDRGSGAIADELLDRVRALLAAPDLELERIVIGQRPMPADDEPLVGPMPGRKGLYAAAMHSGVTLAPGVAELVADELMDGTEAPLLAPFRPGRAMA